MHLWSSNGHETDDHEPEFIFLYTNQNFRMFSCMIHTYSIFYIRTFQNCSTTIAIMQKCEACGGYISTGALPGQICDIRISDYLLDAMESVAGNRVSEKIIPESDCSYKCNWVEFFGHERSQLEDLFTQRGWKVETKSSHANGYSGSVVLVRQPGNKKVHLSVYLVDDYTNELPGGAAVEILVLKASTFEVFDEYG